MTPSDPTRLAALSAQLFEVHDWLRENLASLRSGPTDLLTHCVTFCSVLSAHHRDEDDNLFPALAAENPALAEVLATLRRDHEQVAEILRAIDTLLRRPDAGSAAGRELDTLAAVLESHLTYEERTLASVLDALRPPLDLTGVLPPSS